MREKLRIIAHHAFREEKEYAVELLMTELPGIEWEIQFTPESSGYLVELPNGCSVSIRDDFFREVGSDYLSPEFIPDRGANTENPFDQSPLAVLYGEPIFSLEGSCYYCGLDLFASAYFMATRWEEYVLPFRDEHGRFPADRSLAFRSGWLDRPVVHEWSQLLRQILESLGFNPPEKQARFRLEISCDVDHPLLWWQSSDWLRTTGGALFRRHSLKEAVYWLKYKMTSNKDPYDVFDEWLEMFEQHQLAAQFNFLSEREHGSDCWYPVRHPFVLEKIREISSRGHKIGLHTSYESFNNTELIAMERTALERITGLSVTSSRAHYLRFGVPDTWRCLHEAGISTDSTAGYPEAEGFRTGMCTSYPVFDFLNRKKLPLQEQPLVAMDVTLALYRRYSPGQALERLFNLKKEVLKYNGTFTLLWHNSSWNTHFWIPWKNVLANFISESRQL